MDNSERPLFIIGAHRSGTTLLRFMLNSSPRIYIPPESDFVPRFFLHNPTGPLSEGRIVEILDTVFSRYRLVKEWQGEVPSPDTFLQWMPTRTPAGFLQALYGEYARQHGAVRWGDKTPIYTSYVDLIHAILPQAQFVHILRDGRDVALSMLDKWGKKEPHVDIYFAARNWVRRVRQGRTSGARLGSGLYYELRYESLVEDPEVHLRQLCTFLAEPYVPEMAEPHRLGQQQIPVGDFHAPVRQAPHQARVGRWKREMPAADLRLFQQVAGSLLSELGYELAPMAPMPFGERLRFAVLAIKYQVLQVGRAAMQAMSLVPPI